jgi:hypothetical protein
VEIKATDGNGVPEVKLRLNGLVINEGEKSGNLFIWSGKNDELLSSLKAGMYHFEAEATDVNGLSSTAEINVSVGTDISGKADDWKNQIHQVILNEGEILRDGEIREFPRLDCYLTLEDDGAFVLMNGTPSKKKGKIWGTNGKANRPKPHPIPFRFYTTVENGQLIIYREKQGRPKVKIYSTNPAKKAGSYKLGITAEKRLAVFRENEGKIEFAWRSN